jgi:hypothetical protein
MKPAQNKTAEADKVPFWEKIFYGAGSGTYIRLFTRSRATRAPDTS